LSSSRPYAPSQPDEAEADRLFRRFRETGDPALRAELVSRYEDLARCLAAKFAHRGEPLEDLLQVALIGLIHAVDRFDPDRGLRFSTFATPTIVGEIKRHFRDRSWHLKVPRWLQELNHRVIRAAEELTPQLSRSPTVPEIARYVGCSEEAALEAMELGHAHDTISLDTHLSASGEAGDAALTLLDALGTEDGALRRVIDYDELMLAVGELDRREQSVLYLRFYKQLSQSEVAGRLSISQMHVSRLQQRALHRLRERLETHPAASADHAAEWRAAA